MKPPTLLCLALTACSSLDPSVGPLRVEQPATEDGGASADAEPDADDSDGFFAREIRPLMDRPGKGDPSGRGCRSCHYRSEAQHTGSDLSGLDLSTLGTLRHGGGSSGARIVVPGKPDESAIVQALRGSYPYANRMPKNGNPFWSDAEIQKVVDWVASGAKGRSDE